MFLYHGRKGSVWEMFVPHAGKAGDIDFWGEGSVVCFCEEGNGRGIGRQGHYVRSIILFINLCGR